MRPVSLSTNADSPMIDDDDDEVEDEESRIEDDDECETAWIPSSGSASHSPTSSRKLGANDRFMCFVVIDNGG